MISGPHSSSTINGLPTRQADDTRREDQAIAQATQRVRGRPGGFRRIAQAPATYLLLAVNVAVYLWMLHAGVDRLTPSPEDLIRFGANNAEAVVAGHQWWRVVTATFVHVGLIHLATNMWCLWNLGVIGEPLLGFTGVVYVYLLTGAAGNLLSVAFNIMFQQRGEVGAGASGAVFGIAGILIVLFSNKRLAQPRPGFAGIPLRDLQAIRRSVVYFAGLNLLIGVGTMARPLMHGLGMGDLRIDNTAHVGGFLTGLCLGVPLLPRMTSGRAAYLARQKITFFCGALLLSLFAAFIAALR